MQGNYKCLFYTKKRKEILQKYITTHKKKHKEYTQKLIYEHLTILKLVYEKTLKS